MFAIKTYMYSSVYNFECQLDTNEEGLIPGNVTKHRERSSIQMQKLYTWSNKQIIWWYEIFIPFTLYFKLGVNLN